MTDNRIYRFFFLPVFIFLPAFLCLFPDTINTGGPIRTDHVITDILPVKEQVSFTNDILQKRLDEIVPQAMRAAEIDMWLIICQEDNLDPVYKTMIPMDAYPKVLQMLVFVNQGEGNTAERFNISMTNTGKFYNRPWKGGGLAEQWKKLIEIIEKKDPKKIGINTDSLNWASGGLTSNLHQQLLANLPEKFKNRLVTAGKACTFWGMTLTKAEIDLYPAVSAIARKIIQKCFCPEAIIPGKTTVNDLEWLYWQICAANGLELSFKPYFSLQRSPADARKFAMDDGVIREGDIVVCDVGIKYLGLFTDHQETAYIRRDNENDAPQGLKKILEENTRLQQVFLSEFTAGRTGNQILTNVFAKAKSAGIERPFIYSHSIGLFVHEPGPVIGYPWEQKPVPGRGELTVESNSVYAMELGVLCRLPEWDNDEVYLPSEQLIVFTGARARLVDNVQKEFYLI